MRSAPLPAQAPAPAQAPTPTSHELDLTTGAATAIGALTTGSLQGIAIVPAVVPEPGTWALLASGLASLAALAARRRHHES